MPSSLSSSSPPNPRTNRIKRKPAPTVDFNEKYPPPDPTDPFAPLSVLRSRSSGAALTLGSQDNLCSPSFLISGQQRPSFNIYPSLSSATDYFGARPKSSSSAKPARESHYRTRSQSVAAFQAASSSPYGFWHQQSFVLEPDILPVTPSPPSLIQDDSSGTESDLEFLPVHSRGPVTHFLAPRKTISQNFERPRTADCVPTKINKVSSLSTMHQVPRRQRKASSALLFTKRRPKTADSSASSDVESFGQSETAFVRECGSPLAKAISPPSPDSSAGSSYVHVSSPSESSATSYDPPSSSTSSYSVPLSSEASARVSTTTASVRHHPSHPAPPVPPKAEWVLPTPGQIERAGALTIIAQNGLRVPFSSIFASQRTIVVFIRHFWCPLCQDYMVQLTRLVDPALLAISGLRLVVIGNGASGMVPKYKQMFNSPFEVYTDPSLRVHEALGMGVVDKGAKKVRRKGEPADYVKHGAMSGFAAVVFRALKVGLPLWEKGGNASQLGGEFVLGPGNTCTYAHRMQTTSGHAPILDVLKSIGIHVPPPEPYVPELDISPTSCLGSPKDVAFARASMDIRPQTAVTKPSMSSLPQAARRRSFACTRASESDAAHEHLRGHGDVLTMEHLPVIDIKKEDLSGTTRSVVAETVEVKNTTDALYDSPTEAEVENLVQDAKPWTENDDSLDEQKSAVGELTCITSDVCVIAQDEEEGFVTPLSGSELTQNEGLEDLVTQNASLSQETDPKLSILDSCWETQAFEGPNAIDSNVLHDHNTTSQNNSPEDQALVTLEDHSVDLATAA